MDKVDVVVIGAGVVGAALARRFAASGKSVIVMEKHSRVAEGTTSRNSGVIHSGIYYPPESLKAKLCVRGKELLYEWVRAHNVPHLMTGKAIVATNAAEEITLAETFENARRSGATAISMWDSKKLKSALPDVTGTTAMFAAETGIVDPFAYTASLLADAEENGALTLTDCEVTALEPTSHGFRIESSRGPIEAALVLNAAGLYADDIARLAGIDKYKIYPCRGDYFRLRSTKRFPHLIYPVKAKGDSGLGIHLTIDLNGGFRLGPDTEYVDSKDDFCSADHKLEKFRKAAEKLLGPLLAEQLEYDQCGIRPKLRARDEPAEKDFVISQDAPGLVNFVGIESPGLTSALAIAEYAEGLLK